MRFRGEYYFLSNMYECPITYNGLTYKCVESAFQAQKDLSRSKDFINLNGFEAKRLGRKIHLRSDWEYVKLSIMKSLLQIKFSDIVLLNKLKSINEPIIEENTWHDTYWGMCNRIGYNHLGILLEEIKNNV